MCTRISGVKTCAITLETSRGLGQGPMHTGTNAYYLRILGLHKKQAIYLKILFLFVAWGEKLVNERLLLGLVG